MNEQPLRVLVVDDSALFRKIVRATLERIPGVEVVGAVGNGRLALARIIACRPDLVTLDLEMPELDGLGLLEELSRRRIAVATIMVSSFTAEGAAATTAALRRGAFDFVLKPAVADSTAGAAQLLADLAPKVEACRQSRRKPPTPSNCKKLTALRPVAYETRGTASGHDNAACRISIVGIGVSTGGPAALGELLSQLPADFPCPILVVQHMPPLFTNSLAEDLNRRCRLHVVEGADGAAIDPGQVVIAPGGQQMRVATTRAGAVVQITDDPAERNCKPAVDYLFRSLAEQFGDRALGVVLTGMGDDGTRGARALKRGATVVVQDESSSVVFGMPKSVIDAGLADVVLPLGEIAEQLQLVACQAALA